jgi:uncharacterized protein HemY
MRAIKMKKLFLLIIASFFVILMMIKGKEYNFIVSLSFLDYIIEISLLGIILFIGLSFIILYQIARISIFINNLPENYRNSRSNKFIQQDLENLLKSYVAILVGETSEAKKTIAKDGNFARLLQLQIAIKEKNDFLTEKLINELLMDKNTKFIAYKYLADLKLSQENFQDALKAALAGIDIKPCNDELLKILSDIYLKLNAFEQAYHTHQKIKQKDTKTLSDLAFLAAKYHYEHNDKKEALTWLKKSLQNTDMNLESRLVNIDLLMKLESKNKALDLLESFRKISSN